MVKRAIRGIVTAAVLVALLPHPAGAATAGVTIHDYYFMPSSLTIAVHDTVHWAYNVGAGTATHTVTFNAGFGSGNLTPGSSFSHTFDAPGTFTYYCMYHYNIGMTGTITVQGSNPAPAPTHHATPTPPTAHTTTQAQPTVKTTPKTTSTPTHAAAPATARTTPTQNATTATPSPSTSVLAERPTTTHSSAPWLVIAIILVLGAGGGVVVFARLARSR
jgi:plastocyanin